MTDDNWDEKYKAFLVRKEGGDVILDKARILLKLHDIEAKVGAYGEARWKTERPISVAFGKPRRVGYGKRKRKYVTRYDKTIWYRSPESLYRGVCRYIEKQRDV